jgi:glycerol-3-phosphate dehydrogenase
LAKETVDKVSANNCLTDKTPLWGGNIENFEDFLRENIGTKSKEFNIEENIMRNLILTYGTKFEDVLELTKEDCTLKEKLCQHHLHIKAEVVYARKFEEVKTLDDFLYRRTFIGIGKCRGLDCGRQIETLL